MQLFATVLCLCLALCRSLAFDTINALEVVGPAVQGDVNIEHIRLARGYGGSGGYPLGGGGYTGGLGGRYPGGNGAYPLGGGGFAGGLGGAHLGGNGDYPLGGGGYVGGLGK